MIKPLHEQYNDRLKAEFDSWLSARKKENPVILLDEAKSNIWKIEGLLTLANLPDSEKAARMQYGGIGIWTQSNPPDYSPDILRLLEKAKDISNGNFDSEKYPNAPDYYDADGMSIAGLESDLEEKIIKEYEDHVVSVFLEMDSTDILLHSKAYLRLDIFYFDLYASVSNMRMSHEALTRMLNLENTLNTVFGEYEGMSLADFIEQDEYPGLEDFYTIPRTVTPSQDMRF